MKSPIYALNVKESGGKYAGSVPLSESAPKVNVGCSGPRPVLTPSFMETNQPTNQPTNQLTDRPTDRPTDSEET